MIHTSNVNVLKSIVYIFLCANSSDYITKLSDTHVSLYRTAAWALHIVSSSNIFVRRITLAFFDLHIFPKKLLNYLLDILTHINKHVNSFVDINTQQSNSRVLT